jgi:hypothetical protein
MSTQHISVLDVQARWAYSEITGAVYSPSYDSLPDIDALRAARRARTPFEELSPTQRYSLAWGCFSARPALMLYLLSVSGLILSELTRADLAAIMIPPNVWHPESQGRFVPFEHFITTRACDPKDSRNVVCSPESYKLPNEPLTIGYFYQHRVLLDGYHRAVAFWKCAPAHGRLPAYVPASPPIGQIQ